MTARASGRARSARAEPADDQASEIAETPTFSPWFVPVKLVQLFVDPCYYSLCRLSDYAEGATALPAELGKAGNYRLWSQPLAIQLPSLVLLDRTGVVARLEGRATGHEIDELLRRHLAA